MCKNESRYAVLRLSCCRILGIFIKRCRVAALVCCHCYCDIIQCRIEVHWSDLNEGEVHYESVTVKNSEDYTAGKTQEIAQFLRNTVDFVLGRN